jgi:hypothetical protein
MSAEPRVPGRPPPTLRRAYLSGDPDASVQAHLRIGGNGPTVLLLIEAGCTVAVPDRIGAGGTTYDARETEFAPPQSPAAVGRLAKQICDFTEDLADGR